jgi:signal transduction histidine kinase
MRTRRFALQQQRSYQFTKAEQGRLAAAEPLMIGFVPPKLLKAGRKPPFVKCQSSNARKSGFAHEKISNPLRIAVCIFAFYTAASHMREFLPGFHQLRTRLLYLMLVALLPACALVLYGNFEQLKLEKESLRQQAIASAKLAASTQDHYIRNARHLLATLNEFSFLTLGTNRLFSELHFKNLRLISPDYADFGLIETNGQLFSSATITNASPMLTNLSVFKQLASTRRFCVSTFEKDPLAGVPTLRVAYPVFDTNHVFRRILYASIRLELLSQALTNITVLPGATISVLDSRGNFIARYPDPENWVEKNVRNEPFVEELFRGPGRTYETIGLDKSRRLFASTTVGDGDSPTLYVTVGMPTATLYAHANWILRRNFFALIFVAAFALGAAWLSARELFLKPVNAIVSAARRLATGDFSARTGLPEAHDELHQLAKDFDTMAENLARNQAELRAANEQIKKFNTELEQRVRERTAELEATNRELEAFSYSVSHDLRAPLRHLDGFAQILATEPSLANDARALRYLDLITKSAKKMGMLIDDLLTFSRMGRQALESRPVRMDDILREAIAEFKSEQEGRAIDWKIQSLPKVAGDPSMLRQAWVNLVSNALKYTRGRNPAIIEIGCREERDEYVFWIRDNGAGFDMKYVDKIFGVFQRLHRDEEFEGTGIGLANVRRIVTRHHGRTWAEAEVDKGATIYFSLPKHSPAPSA